MSEKRQEPFACHAILELMGHRRMGGYVTEQTIAGMAFIRIDVPATATSKGVTQWYAPASVYAITPVDAETAEALAAISQPAPVQRWELPPVRESATRTAAWGEDEDDERLPVEDPFGDE